MKTMAVLSLFLLAALGVSAQNHTGQTPRPASSTETPPRPLRNLNTSYFPFTPVKDAAEWAVRREEIRNRILLATGLLPMPERTPLHAVIHGRMEREDYTVEKVCFESLPGNFVTGNLYLPRRHGDKIPGILCPHGHWPDGRFMHAADAEVQKQLTSGAEQFENAARSPLQARCVQLARMGCAVFHYDMLGCADSVQFCDATGKPSHRHGPQPQGFLSNEAELNLCGFLPLQTWNSVRALDFIMSLPFVDQARIGCTGASGGGTQTMLISAIDDRITAAFPCVMVSTAMQGGCICENSPYLRIGQGNIDIAALTAPRPLGMTTADDWTKELATKGFPDLKQLFTLLGAPDNVEMHANNQFPHNYNAVSRAQMYRFFNKHFALGLSDALLTERDFKLSTRQELSVWDTEHPAPHDDAVGTSHEDTVIKWFKQQGAKQLQPITKATSQKLLRTAWEIMIGTKLPKQGGSTFSPDITQEHGDHVVLRGMTHNGDNSVECTLIHPKGKHGAAVLWLSLKGEESIVSPAGDLTAPARQLLAAGYAIACPKLYLQGATRNPNVYGARKQAYEGFSGYHYGYNPSLFAERVHDALTMVAMLRGSEMHRADRIIVAGVEGAGAIAAAATAFSGPAVNQLVTNLAGFRFAKLGDVWDVNFVPGAEKYGDVPALLSLCSAPTTVLDEQAAVGADTVAQAITERP